MASLATNDDDDDNNNIPTKESIIENIKALIDDEQLLLAVEKLKLLNDKEIVELSKNNNYIRFAKQCKEELNTFLTQLSPIDTSASSDWVAVSEETEKYRVWYKQEKETSSYTFRVEGMVNAKLFNILAVIYEFDLFKTWFPGVGVSDKDIQLAKFRMIVSLVGDQLPWPFWSRKSILYGYGDVFNNDSVAIYIRDAVETDLTQNITDPKTSNLNNDDIDKEKEKIVVDETQYVNSKCLYGGFHVIPVTEEKTFIKFAFNFDPQFQLLPTSFFNFLIQGTMIPLLGLITKKAKNIEGTEYEKRINSDESSAVYAEMRKRLTKIDYSNNGCYKKYLLKSQIEIVEQRLAIWRKQKGKNIINSESGK